MFPTSFRLLSFVAIVSRMKIGKVYIFITFSPHPSINIHFLESTAGCEVCGDHRRLAWSAVDFHNTSVEHKVITDDPVQGFLDYLLHSLNRDYETKVFAHCGGSFDNMFAFRKLYQAGGLTPKIIRRETK